jgi:hypothetical protein
MTELLLEGLPKKMNFNNFCGSASDCSNITKGARAYSFDAKKECSVVLSEKCADANFLFLDPEVCPDEGSIEWLRSMNSWTLTDCHRLSDCELIPLKWLNESVVEPFCKDQFT